MMTDKAVIGLSPMIEINRARSADASQKTIRARLLCELYLMTNSVPPLGTKDRDHDKDWDGSAALPGGIALDLCVNNFGFAAHASPPCAASRLPALLRAALAAS
jgi:hypothetical protein